jgi:predicted transcriptional regulator
MQVMISAKDEVLATIERLPADATMEDILSELHFKAKVLRGIEQAERGDVIPHSQVMEELEQWLKSIGQ